jgi:TetR/AcrR family transcriptional repressor of lmrAB and yxaGH operons
MRKGDVTRTKMIAAAANLFEREGYSGAGLNGILDASDAPRGSLYFHFPGGKEELAIAAINAASEKLDADVEAVLKSARKPASGLARVVELLAERLAQSGYEKSCPIASVVSTSSAAPEGVRDAASTALLSLEARLAGYLVLHGMPQKGAEHRAGIVLAAIEGALVLGRIHRSTAPLLRLAKAMPLLVDQA